MVLKSRTGRYLPGICVFLIAGSQLWAHPEWIFSSLAQPSDGPAEFELMLGESPPPVLIAAAVDESQRPRGADPAAPMPSGIAVESLLSSQADTQKILYSIAKDTGGPPPIPLQQPLPRNAPEELKAAPQLAFVPMGGEQGEGKAECDGHSMGRGMKPLIVMATTMGHAGANDFKRKIQQNVLRGFMAQTPLDAVHPLVFTDNKELIAEVRAETKKVHGDGLDVVEEKFEQVCFKK